MRSPSDRAVILEALRDEAVRVGIIDTGFARLADTSQMWIADDGIVHGTSVAVAALRQRCPAIFIDDASKFGELTGLEKDKHAK